MGTKTKIVLFLILITFLGLFFRLWNINFGLPHSFYADEPEIAELAIKYTYEIKNIVSEGNYYKLIPISYVYGTFPSYLFTIFTMGFSKISNVIGDPATKYGLYVAMRVFNAILSFLIVPTVSYIFYKLTKKTKLSLVVYFLLALNWKLIVHAHYINADIILTLLLSLSFLTTLLYLEKQKEDTLLTLITGALLGLAIGTKITALISLPLFLWIFYSKGRLMNVLGLFFVALTAFALSNPFSLIFAGDFTFRIYEMIFKEAGLVFDSVDTGVWKYLKAVLDMITPALAVFAIAGVMAQHMERDKTHSSRFKLFLFLNIIFYILFFSLQSRRVDRWILPVLPIIICFSAWGFEKTRPKKWLRRFVFAIIFITYIYYPALLLTQFQRWTPKSAAYLWAKENIPETTSTLVYTEEGLDPMNKLSGAKVYQYEVYSSKGAELFYPKDPGYYDYIVISSRPMENHKRPEVKNTYPEYYERWSYFLKELNNREKFEKIQEFELSKPNLIPLSDVTIYKSKTKKDLPVGRPVPYLQVISESLTP